MPVELVEFVHGEDVDILFDLVYRPEVAAGIEHAPAVSEIGFVLNRYGGQHALAVDDQLAQALQAVEHTLRCTAVHLDTRRSHRKFISLGFQRAVHRQADVARGGSLHNVFGKNPGRTAQFGIFPDADLRRRGYGKSSLAGLHREGFGNDIGLGSHSEGRARQTDGAQRQKEFFHLHSGYS